MDAYLIGVGCTAFGKRPQHSFHQLVQEALNELLQDASQGGAFDAGAAIESIWFSNCGMGSWGQANIRGQVLLTPWMMDGRLPAHTPVVNVEGGCASASLALHGACRDVLSRQVEVSLALGVEKMVFADDPARSFALLEGAIDQLQPQTWRDYYQRAGEAVGKPFGVVPDRSIFMQTYAMQAAWHAQHHGSTSWQLACAAAKTHNNGALNPKAQYRFEMTPQAVLEDRMVSDPLTRAMCAPVGDGAAAALVCSGHLLATLPAAVRQRAVRVAGMALSGGRYRGFDEPGLTWVAAQKVYRQAGLVPGDVDFAEVHDATSFAEIYQPEMLGLCERGQGGLLAESGASARDGRLPINPSGGLISKGHPIGATGLSMVYESVRQLRREAGPLQLPRSACALIENGGGVIGFDEAVCAVTLLQAV
jgi:acetyl-CoA acetyltransferase